MDGFRFGDKRARDDLGGCCGKPVGCGIESRGCVHKVEKRAWQEAAEQEIAARAREAKRATGESPAPAEEERGG